MKNNIIEDLILTGVSYISIIWNEETGELEMESVNPFEGCDCVARRSPDDPT